MKRVVEAPEARGPSPQHPEARRAGREGGPGSLCLPLSLLRPQATGDPVASVSLSVNGLVRAVVGLPGWWQSGLRGWRL